MRKNGFTKHLFSLSFIATLLCPAWFVGTNINLTFPYSWGPNIGWINWAGDVTNGATFANVASGYIWSGNVGWIHLGDGTPANGIQYSNTSATDYGVNIDRTSDATYQLLSGFAYGANIGWINFNVVNWTGIANRPRIQRSTGRLLGYAWSANVGWLPLNSEPFSKVVVQLDNAVPGAAWKAYR